MPHFLYNTRYRNVAVPSSEPDPDPGGPTGPTQTITYQEDLTGRILNPDRGFRRPSQFGHSGYTPTTTPYDYSWQGHRNVTNITVEGTTINGLGPVSGALFEGDLRGFLNGAPLSQAYLNGVRSSFASARSNGLTLEVRFSYMFNPVTGSWSEPSSAQIMSHMDQLQPVLEEYKDIISHVHAGWLGDWGEHGARNPEYGGRNPAVRNALFKHWLDALPATKMMTFRYPNTPAEYYRGGQVDTASFPRDAVIGIYPGTEDLLPLTRANRFDNSDVARVGGMYNDSYLGNPTDGGTYIDDRYRNDGQYPYNNQMVLRRYWSSLTKFSPASGETVNNWWGLPNRFDEDGIVVGIGTNSADAMRDMAYHSMDGLNTDFYVPFMVAWEGDGGLNEIANRLGYRLVLTSSVLPTSIERGNQASVIFNMKNAGFGKVYNVRPINLVFIPQGGGAPVRVQLTQDSRRDLPLGGETSTLTYGFSVPNLATGTYNLALELPAAYSVIQTDPRYSIRLANIGTWDGANGRGWNSLNASLTVTG